MNFFFPKPNKGPSTTKLKPSHQTPSPHAEALAQIVANLGSVFELGHLDSEDLVFHVPNLVSQLVTGYLSGKKYQDLRQETDARNQEIVDFIRVSHLESQKKEAEWRGEEAQYITRIDDIREERDQQAQLREERENTIRTLETKWALHVADVNTKHEEAERRMKEKYEEKERRMKEDHEFLMQGLQGTIQALTTHMEKQKDEFVVEKTKLEEAHRTKQDDLTEKFEAHQTKLKQAHKKQQEQLQKEIQSRNKALIAREKFSPMTDGDLKSVFSDLVAEVNALARLEWTLNRSKWTDVLLRQVSDNPKRLQKQILKETIWNALFENIFCSPFRVFGEEGSVLESQWNKAFGKDPKAGNDQYIWPQPSFDAERWRYETMNQCQEALRISTSEYDPRTKLRKGFQTSMKIVHGKLGEALEKVLKIDDKTEQTITEIAEQAAEMWVGFGTQRCRLLVVMQDLKMIEETRKEPGEQQRSVELITQPGLRRIGDAEGESLDIEEMVAGCNGEMRKILYNCQ